MSTTVETGKKRTSSVRLIATSLTLFSMFFGAGNLIFPPMIGVEAGTSFLPAITGFLLGGVALPVLSIIVIALSGTDLRDLSNRGGRIFGVIFSCAVYLSIGAFYALPRTGAVSFSTAVSPLTGWTSTSVSVIFNALFFALAFYLSWKPGEIIDRLGKILTPLLLGLLTLLAIVSVFTFDGTPGAPSEQYASHPLTAGILSGYLTMDSLGGLAFGIIVVTSFTRTGGGIGAKTVKRTSIAATIAGGLLALVYLSLGLIGLKMPGAHAFDNGAELLSQASNLALGPFGQIAFGLIVVTACMTTAVGLLVATSEFFARLMPKIRYETWLAGFAIISFIIASAGLNKVLAVAGPIIGLLYPVAITIIFITIFTHPLRHITRCELAFKLSAWTASALSILATLQDLGIAAESIEGFIGWLPGHAESVAWVIPTILMAIIGLVIDSRLARSGN
ncbi:branched-chain amino acid transport system II carrier protein [Schaalia cardiffensis]|uniref:branched-chain amino acid transport system II carrier protein n=1 Tax=Schaalia cardiffensis TaxID=181487 RepID=UPI002AB24B3B|nr:branched-chain amino acid transport system II carrier protein [Schaalia cardiffensis]